MNREPDEIYTGGSFIPTPKKPNLNETEERIFESPNMVRAKWDQKSGATSQLVQNFVRQNSGNLERMEASNRFQISPDRIYAEIRWAPQLGASNENVKIDEEEKRGIADRNPRRRKFGKRPPPHPMTRRSQKQK